MGRKTTTSYEVKQRWRAKGYKQFNVNFRTNEDADLIEFVDMLKANGLQTAEIFRYAMRLYMNDYEKNQG